MGSIKLDDRSLRMMNVFFTNTRVEVMDVLEDESVIVFVIFPGSLQKALQNNGSNIQKIRELLGKNIWVLEYNMDPKRFVSNFFYRYRVTNVQLDDANGKFSIVVHVNMAEKARAIGKDGKNLKLARELMNRYFPVESIQIQ